MPVGTAATVKAMLPSSVRSTGADILLGNTYHLMLRPTAERIASLGGLHKFMDWEYPILTDSGGFQVMSLSALTKISEKGVKFKSHIDGSIHLITPERSIELQSLFGSDISMCFDECTPYPVDEKTALNSMQMSMRWAERSREAFGYREGRSLFGIQQGSVFSEQREESAEALKSIGFDGYAVGGLAVGEGQEKMFEVLKYAPDFLPSEKPRYLMGVGKPDDIVGAVKNGIDMMDCVLPSRSGRTGQIFTHRGVLNIKNSSFAINFSKFFEHGWLSSHTVTSNCPYGECLHTLVIHPPPVISWYSSQFSGLCPETCIQTKPFPPETKFIRPSCSFSFKARSPYLRVLKTNAS